MPDLAPALVRSRAVRHDLTHLYSGVLSSLATIDPLPPRVSS